MTLIQLDTFLESFSFGDLCLEDKAIKYRHCELCGNHSIRVLREISAISAKDSVCFPSAMCEKCGYVQQQLLLSQEFYKAFYSKQYSVQQALSGNKSASSIDKITGEKYLDSVKNGEQRASFFSKFLEDAFGINSDSLKGNYLDVGCGSGGFLSHFKNCGWNVYGNDPDLASVKCAEIYRSIVIDHIGAEEMSYEVKFDLITIVGSLEHCIDPSRVLRKCKSMLKEDGLLAVSGRFHPIGYSHQYLNFNHHRFLREKQLQLLLKYNGFDTILKTAYPVLGENTGRDGEGWCFARHEKWTPSTDVSSYARLSGLYESFDELDCFLAEHDRLLDKK